MLALPTIGVSRSVHVHKVDLDIFCDWIESSLLFEDDEISSTDIADTLVEENIYNDYDMASEIVSSAWTELRRRQSWISQGTPFSIGGYRISRILEWREVPGHSFCLLLSLSKWYRSWAQQFGTDYTEQGELFEELTKESLETQFSDWQIYRTGWSRTHTDNLGTIVQEVATRLAESVGDIGQWTSPRAKDAGLDLLCYRPFPDRRVGIPVYLMQCASGGDWDEKLRIPDLKIWTKIVVFTAFPKKAFATPFAFLDHDFIRNCNIVDGMVLDRYRLLAAAKTNEQWVSAPLRKRLVTWMEPRVSSLPGFEA